MWRALNLISLCIHTVWSRSALFSNRMLKTNVDSSQTKWMYRLIWVYTGRTCYKVVFDLERFSCIDTVFHITKTCLYNFDPFKPHVYIVKLGFTEVCIICLISAQNIDCMYMLELSQHSAESNQGLYCLLRPVSVPRRHAWCNLLTQYLVYIQHHLKLNPCHPE